jgi:lipoate-protein ligase B
MDLPVEFEVRRHLSGRQEWTYALLDQRQREIADRVKNGGKGALLLSELAPVITLGRRARVESLLFAENELRKKGISVYPTDRGGLETYHGPGQWVLFLVERLDRLTGDPRGIRTAVQGLLEVAALVGRCYRPEVRIGEGAELGVWSSRGKFAAVGVHVTDGILMHGLSLNGFCTETSFVGLRPCGLDAPVDFLLSDLSLKSQLVDRQQEDFQRLGWELYRAVVKRFWDFNESSVDERVFQGYIKASSR